MVNLKALFVLTRRQFVRRSVIGLAAVSGTGLAIDGFFVEPHRPVPEHIDVHLTRLPEAFEGFRIAQITDIHFGPYMDTAGLERAVHLAQDFRPDLVALTGDFVSHPLYQHNGLAGARNAEPCADVFARWKGAPPMIAVLGNHDHWNNPDMVTGSLRERGIVVLRNASHVIEREKQLLWIAGTDDALESRADVMQAIAQIPPTDATILLAHEPDFADHAAKFPVDLQLSGHSHGGQVRLPGIGPIILPDLARKYHTGLNRVGRLQVFTSHGVGVINPPVRLNCPPKISLLTLHKDMGIAANHPEMP
jgi:predicted MPP superfamily phosphohydrolase